MKNSSLKNLHGMLAVVLALCVALVLPGCGGVSTPPTATPAAGQPAADAASAQAQAEAQVAAQRAELAQREAALAERERELTAQRAAEAAEAAAKTRQSAPPPKAVAATERPAASRPRPSASQSRPVKSAADNAAGAPVSVVKAEPPRPVVLPSGTQLAIAFTSNVSTKTAAVGDPVSARLAEPLVFEGRTVVPAGAQVRGTITDVYSGSKQIGGTPRLGMRFDQIVLADGRRLAIDGDIAQRGNREAGRDAAKIAGGAVVGAVLGKQVDDNRGKVIGGLLGAGVGAAIAKNTGGDLEIADGTTVAFTLSRSLEIR